MTAVFESAIDNALKRNAWKRVTSQVVIRPTDIELTGRFVNGPWHADLRVRLTPSVHDGGVSFTPVDVRIGDYPLPPSIAYQVVGTIFSRNLGTFFLRFENTSLKDFRLNNGSLTVVAAPQGAISGAAP